MIFAWAPKSRLTRLAGLKLIFLIVTRAVSLLRLSQREVWWKDAEILILRHQLAVAQREQPRVLLARTDRACSSGVIAALSQ
jgi:putative transposase